MDVLSRIALTVKVLSGDKDIKFEATTSIAKGIGLQAQKTIVQRR